MSTIIMAIAPIFGLISLGFILRRIEFPGPGFWPVSERLTYYVLFPALLVSGLAGRSFDESATGLAVVLFVAVSLVAVLLLAIKPFLRMDGPVFTSVFQGAIRPNTYVGLSAAAALLGPDWMALSAVALLTLIPLVNVLCVLVLSHHGRNCGGAGRVVVELVRNPLILACVVGFVLNGFDVVLPAVLNELLVITGKAALPLGLLAVGAGLRFESLHEQAVPVFLASLAHLAVLPLAALGCALPVSVSAFILARQMGGDHRCMALIITVQTILSAVTLPLVLGVFGG